LRFEANHAFVLQNRCFSRGDFGAHLAAGEADGVDAVERGWEAGAAALHGFDLAEGLVEHAVQGRLVADDVFEGGGVRKQALMAHTVELGTDAGDAELVAVGDELGAGDRRDQLDAEVFVIADY
jgi:hypothetical protein